MIVLGLIIIVAVIVVVGIYGSDQYQISHVITTLLIVVILAFTVAMLVVIVVLAIIISSSVIPVRVLVLSTVTTQQETFSVHYPSWDNTALGSPDSCKVSCHRHRGCCSCYYCSGMLCPVYHDLHSASGSLCQHTVCCYNLDKSLPIIYYNQIVVRSLPCLSASLELLFMSEPPDIVVWTYKRLIGDKIS